MLVRPAFSSRLLRTCNSIRLERASRVKLKHEAGVKSSFTRLPRSKRRMLPLHPSLYGDSHVDLRAAMGFTSLTGLATFEASRQAGKQAQTQCALVRWQSLSFGGLSSQRLQKNKSTNQNGALFHSNVLLAEHHLIDLTPTPPASLRV